MDAFLAKTVTGLDHIDSKYSTTVADNVEFYIKSVAVSKMSIIAMIKGKLRLVNKSKIYNQPSFFASFESEVFIDDFTMQDLRIIPGDIVFHLLSTKFEISNTKISNINCTAKDETIF